MLNIDPHEYNIESHETFPLYGSKILHNINVLTMYGMYYYVHNEAYNISL